MKLKSATYKDISTCVFLVCIYSQMIWIWHDAFTPETQDSNRDHTDQRIQSGPRSSFGGRKHQQLYWVLMPLFSSRCFQNNSASCNVRKIYIFSRNRDFTRVIECQSIDLIHIKLNLSWLLRLFILKHTVDISNLIVLLIIK